MAKKTITIEIKSPYEETQLLNILTHSEAYENAHSMPKSVLRDAVRGVIRKRLKEK